ncbi:FUSC family protein [Biostraticola tofi]|uniref:Fusaric acid resistance family protein n=1 Tax=Biostraticola tofi TaxID=466109 RepID=A0A4R3Z4F8_9GAMM|nr:FUSC family protein [Biostraticola tofi]TCW00178.1 fusaric acid resistance family protein [Biostraticola tofi]
MRLDRKISSLEHVIYQHYQLAHGLRISLAFVLTFLIVRLLQIPEGSWPLITLVVVMGPISFWGNVLQRAMQRIAGTLFGALSGLIALRLELYSLPLMLLWCGGVMFICGYLTLGKRPYMALLIGITLAVVCGGTAGDMETALWRSGDVIIGSLLALLFTSIYPQRAFIHWRRQMGLELASLSKIYAAYLSPNVIDRPRLEGRLKKILNEVVKRRALLTPASKESRVGKEVFDAIQTLNRNIVCVLELQIDAWWASRESHFILLNATTLRITQRATLRTLMTLAEALREGNPEPIVAERTELAGIASELTQLMQQATERGQAEAAIYGYVWLSLRLTEQLEQLAQLLCLALRKPLEPKES